MESIEQRAIKEAIKAREAAKGLDETIEIHQPNGIICHGYPEFAGCFAGQGYLNGATEQWRLDIQAAVEVYCIRCKKTHSHAVKCGDEERRICKDRLAFLQALNERTI